MWCKESESLAAACTFAASADATGWTGEWAIPLDEVGVSFAKTKELGFNIGIRRTSPGDWVLWASTGASSWVLDDAGTLKP